MKFLEDFLMGYDNLRGKFGWAVSSYREKLYFLLPQSWTLIMTSPLVVSKMSKIDCCMNAQLTTLLTVLLTCISTKYLQRATKV